MPAGLAARRGPGDVVILLYHRVGAGQREIDLPVELFERQLAVLLERERVLSLDEAVQEGGPGGVVLTFDDGYRDFHEHVLPLLERAAVPATLFLATGLMSDVASPGSEALTWSQVEEAVATGLVTIGAHTHDHVDLSRADARRRGRAATLESVDRGSARTSLPAFCVPGRGWLGGRRSNRPGPVRDGRARRVADEPPRAD